MDSGELLHIFTGITVWKQGDKRAPHKPLLILYMLGRLKRGEHGTVSFDEMDMEVGKLLAEFGPDRKTQPLYPFWYLQNDGLWILNNVDKSDEGPLGPPPTKTYFRSRDVRGGFPDGIVHTLVSNPDLIRQIATKILSDNFPSTLHEDILQAVGLDLNPDGVAVKSVKSEPKRSRDPEFRKRVLRAYEYRCAVCGFDVRIGSTPIALEAAHIKWHQAGGPDEEPNGLALCSLHHKLFDRGAFSLDPQRRLLVSESAHGSKGFDSWLMQYHGSPIKEPLRNSYMPHEEYTNWHVREVFRGESRELSC